MVGQKKLLEYFETHDLAPFTIVIGVEGSGKNLLIRESCIKKESIVYILPDIRVDTVRKMITDAYKVNRSVIYIIPDADSMSLAAKNALLKLTEEPPEKARIIMTLEQLDNTLPTIISRARVLELDPYSELELLSFLPDKMKSDTEMASLVRDVCEVPGDVKKLVDAGLDMWYFVSKVTANIHTVRAANALKILDYIALKPDDKKYDFQLFLRMFKAACVRYALQDTTSPDFGRFLEGVGITSSILGKFRINGINKQFLFDRWVFEIREAWR